MVEKRIVSLGDRFQKPAEYYTDVRADLLALLPPGARRILDVGCGAAETWAGFAGEVYGIECQEAAAARARERLAGVLVGDVEAMEFPYPKAFFDGIVCADILEHLYDPWGLLLRLRPHLKPDGCLLISIPNIRYYKVLRSLLFKADFAYTRFGILDIDHVRFFARRNVEWMLRETGFSIGALRRVRGGSFKYRLANRLLFGRLEDFLTKQYYILARLDPGWRERAEEESNRQDTKNAMI